MGSLDEEDDNDTKTRFGTKEHRWRGAWTTLSPDNDNDDSWFWTSVDDDDVNDCR
jgi:hypothetical protein